MNLFSNKQPETSATNGGQNRNSGRRAHASQTGQREVGETGAASRPRVSIHVITYDGQPFLDSCFRTLLERTNYSDFDVTLIDNGSSDGSADYVRREFPQVEIVGIWPNAGFAHAANEAVKHAMSLDAKYVAICNDDVQFIDDRWLDEAVSRMEENRGIGIVVYREVPPQAECVIDENIESGEAKYLSGFVMVMPVRLFESIGMFDEEYFVIAEEDDLGARAFAAGFRPIRLSIPIVHYGGGTNQKSSIRTSYLQMRNGIRYCIKHRGFYRALLRTLRIVDIACNPLPFSYDQQDVAHRRMRGEGHVVVNAWLLMRAVAWNLCALPRTLQIRRGELRAIRRVRAEFDGAATGKSGLMRTEAAKFNPA